MTPVEFRIEVRAADMRRMDDYRRELFSSWHTADLSSRALRGKLRPLEKVIRTFEQAMKRRPKHLHPTDLGMLSEHLGIALRPISPEAKAAMDRLRAAHA